VKIDNSVKSSGALPGGDGRARSAKDSTSTASTSSSASSGKVEISSLSSHLQHMEAVMESTPVVDSAKVAEIRQAMSDGLFKVDTGKVADGLIQSVRQMLSAQGGSE
jgi:negative regulator of flagellin synthesis FlgM